jgi:hypothetical protein
MNDFIIEDREAIENVYILLPRFVTDPDEQPELAEGKYLPAIVRDFEWENLEFTFVISPARVRNEKGEDRYYYPGEREQYIESALRQLAVEDNVNFRSDEFTLDFSLHQIMIELININRDLRLDREDIELGIKILGDINYELIGRNSGGSELYFRPIERLVIREQDGEIYYRAQFSQLFFSRTKQFDFCFPLMDANKTDLLKK